MTHFLKFPDKPAYEALLSLVDSGDSATRLVGPTALVLDVIGTIWQGGTYDAEGKVIIAPTAISGYHVNALGDLPPDWQPYEIPRPSNPVRVFAGVA